MTIKRIFFVKKTSLPTIVVIIELIIIIMLIMKKRKEGYTEVQPDRSISDSIMFGSMPYSMGVRNAGYGGGESLAWPSDRIPYESPIREYVTEGVIPR